MNCVIKEDEDERKKRVANAKECAYKTNEAVRRKKVKITKKLHLAIKHEIDAMLLGSQVDTRSGPCVPSDPLPLG